MSDNPSHPTEFPIEMMNHALSLATEWGENFRKPINDRMRLKYPDLTDEEITRLKKIAGRCRDLHPLARRRRTRGKIGESDIVPMARAKHPWVDEQQLYRIKNIGMYWARR